MINRGRTTIRPLFIQYEGMKYLFLFLIAGFVSSTHAQEGSLSGNVIDNVTKQAVVGAKIALNPSLRAISDFDGNYKLDKVSLQKG